MSQTEAISTPLLALQMLLLPGHIIAKEYWASDEFVRLIAQRAIASHAEG